MKKVLTILGAGVLSLSLFGCSLGEESKNEVSTNDVIKNVEYEPTLASLVPFDDNEPNTLVGPVLEQFQKSVEQKLDVSYNRESIHIELLENDYAKGFVTSIGHGPDSIFTNNEQLIHQKLLSFTYELFKNNSKLDGLFLQMQLDEVYKYYTVEVDKQEFIKWATDTTDEQWEKINIEQLDDIDTSAFFEKYGYIDDMNPM